MKDHLRKVLVVPALAFIVVGLGWWALPGMVAPEFGMSIEKGAGLSTQIGDLGAFFLTLGGCILTGFITRNPVWFYPAMMLLGLTAFGRVVAWVAHGAAFTPDKLAVEISVAILLYVVARQQNT